MFLAFLKCSSVYLNYYHVIYQTRGCVHASYRDIIFWTPRRELKMRRAVEYFDEIRGVLKCDETLSRGFDISSQSKLKLRSKRGKKIAKKKTMLIKLRYQNHRHGYMISFVWEVNRYMPGDSISKFTLDCKIVSLFLEIFCATRELR